MTRMDTQKRPADGLAIRFAESDAVGDETVLLLNPWPESLFAWDTIWTRLAHTARLLAIDLPGFGRSEGRAELLSPRAMGLFLLRLIDEWGLGRPHLVGPDVGTGAVLFALSEDLDRFPSAVARQLRSRAKTTTFADSTPTRARRDIAARPRRSSTGERSRSGLKEETVR